MIEFLIKCAARGLILQSIISIILLIVIIINYELPSEFVPKDWKFPMILFMMGFIFLSLIAHIKNSLTTESDKKCHYCGIGKLEPNSYICKLCLRGQ